MPKVPPAKTENTGSVDPNRLNSAKTGELSEKPVENAAVDHKLPPVEIQDEHSGEIDKEINAANKELKPNTSADPIFDIDSNFGVPDATEPAEEGLVETGDLEEWDDFLLDAEEVAGDDEDLRLPKSSGDLDPEIEEPIEVLADEVDNREVIDYKESKSQKAQTRGERAKVKEQAEKLRKQIRHLGKIAKTRELTEKEKKALKVRLETFQKLVKKAEVLGIEDLSAYDAKSIEFTEVAKQMYPKFAKYFDDPQFSEQALQFLMENPQVTLEDLGNLLNELEKDPKLEHLPDGHKLKDLAKLLGPRIALMLKDVDAADRDLDLKDKSALEIMKEGLVDKSVIDALYTKQEQRTLDNIKNTRQLLDSELYRTLENNFESEDRINDVRRSEARRAESKEESRRNESRRQEAQRYELERLVATLFAIGATPGIIAILQFKGFLTFQDLIVHLGIAQIKSNPILRSEFEQEILQYEWESDPNAPNFQEAIEFERFEALIEQFEQNRSGENQRDIDTWTT